ncbi:Hypothetical predicted protein [Olea europaea subsp. europaea]|uniref:Uncharacterized protein n=1 Tax=Olea europaea subsp. europaea TaxID=158383 RepID=A0A8S0T5K8_OLEEU|nr:Hypothetical predicted protein [Olea europaea subsp. europaea]
MTSPSVVAQFSCLSRTKSASTAEADDEGALELPQQKLMEAGGGDSRFLPPPREDSEQSEATTTAPASKAFNGGCESLGVGGSTGPRSWPSVQSNAKTKGGLDGVACRSVVAGLF